MCGLVALVVGANRWPRRLGNWALISLGVLLLRRSVGNAQPSPVGKTDLGDIAWWLHLVAGEQSTLTALRARGRVARLAGGGISRGLVSAATLEGESLGELEQDRLAYRAAMNTILRMPAVFIVSCIYRVGWLWALWPYDGSFGIVETLIAVWYAMMLMMAYVGLRQLLRRGMLRNWLLGLLLILSLTAIHSSSGATCACVHRRCHA